MRAQQYACRLRMINHMLEDIEEQRKEWMTVATKISAQMGGERVQSSGSHQKMADAVCNGVDLERKLIGDASKLAMEKYRILSDFRKLNTQQYNLMMKVYAGERKNGEWVYMSLKEYANLHHHSYTWATNIHGAAMKKLQEILDKKEAGN